MKLESSGSPLCRAILSMLDYLRQYGPQGEYICHTPTGILEFLKKHGGQAANDRNFPTTADQIGRALSQVAPELKAQRIVIKADRCRSMGRLWTIAREEDFRPAPTARRLRELETRIYER